MQIRSIKEIKSLKNKRVLLRVDFNVPVGDDLKVDKTEDYRLVQTLPTIKYLQDKGAKIIILAHLGRPDGKKIKKLRLDPVANRLSRLLKQDVYKSDEILGKEVEEFIAGMQPGEIFMLENIRFDAREKKGSKVFAQELAKLGDIYVNDGFAVCHRNHVSVATIADYLPSYGGFLLEDEIKNLSHVLEDPEKPFIGIIGGAKISTKIKMIKNFMPIAQNVLLGGALANTVLKVMGIGIGKSPIEPKMVPEIKKIKLTDDQLRVPVDGLMATSFDSKKGRLDALGDIKPDEMILDIGPDTIKLYKRMIKTAKMVTWNGPMGLLENPAFAKGTRGLVKILAKSNAKTVVGGGETVHAIRQLKLEKKFDFVSTGGGAMLEFFEGKKLPGIKKLIK